MRRVVIESPLRGDVKLNMAYAKLCMLDSFKRGEAPFASHLLYAQTGLLSNTVQAERTLGMEAGFLWGQGADLVAVYANLGISCGMAAGIWRAKREGLTVEHRKLTAFWRDLICPSCIEPRLSSAAPCCNVPCGGHWWEGCWHCHHPKHWNLKGR